MIKLLSVFLPLVNVSYAMDIEKPNQNLLHCNSVSNIDNNTVSNDNNKNTVVLENNKKSVDIEALIKNKKFVDMTDDEKDWAKFRAYSKFAELCQSFIQLALVRKEANFKLRNFLCTAKTTKKCIIAGFDVQQIFLDELNFNTCKSCYIALPLVVQQFHLVAKQLRSLYEGLYQFPINTV